MRIAQVAPLTEAVPPKLYGGTERVVSFLTEELVDMGHEVTLFASGDSVTSATLRAGWPQALRLDPSVRDPISLHMQLVETVAQAASEFDVLHCHLDYLTFSVLSRGPTPFVTTLHGRLDLPELQPVFDLFPRVPLVSISDAQRRPLPNAGWVATVQHGLPRTLLTPQEVTPSYLGFLGRICPEKCPDRAITLAERSGIQLRMAAKVDRVDEEYHAQEIAPRLRPGVAELIGEIGDSEKAAFLSGAVALLLPIDWPEPFGLVMIEAMACGTPVIAFNRGSVPEIVEDGLTGFVVEDMDGALDAIRRLHTLDRGAIRRRFEERFTARRMAENYVALYQELAGQRRGHLRVVT